MDAWRTRSRRTVLDLSPWVIVETHAVELSDAGVLDWPWLVMPEYAIVVAVTELGSFPMFRQRKYGVEGLTLSPPGGYLDPGEQPDDAARRELLEETGYEADEWTSLGRYVVDGNRGCGVGHLYLARNARKVAEPAADDLEEQELLSLSRAEVGHALLAGEFKALSWAAAVALALVRLDADG
ncbi:MAG TPA: NUDIX hydrolase [Gaiellaceae bacterium]|nr:NUDIX hydrolase [Gaiellaceae bacterium]